MWKKKTATVAKFISFHGGLEYYLVKQLEIPWRRLV